MESVGGSSDTGFFVVVGVLCLMAFIFAWLSGRGGWHWALSALNIFAGLVILTGTTLAWLIESPYLLFVPQGQSMMHAGGAALVIIGLNALVVALVWLAVLVGLRAVGVARRRRV